MTTIPKTRRLHAAGLLLAACMRRACCWPPCRPARWLTCAQKAGHRRRQRRPADLLADADPDHHRCSACARISPKAALAFTATPDWTLKASLGRAVRNPTAAELFQGAIVDNEIVNSDPALRAEKSWTGELSAERVNDAGVLRVNSLGPLRGLTGAQPKQTHHQAKREHYSIEDERGTSDVGKYAFLSIAA
jgi:hypothetical protein